MIGKIPAKLTWMIGAGAVAGYAAVIALSLVLTGMALATIAEQRASVAASELTLAHMERVAVAPKDDGSPLGDAPAGSPFLQGETLNVGGAALLQQVATDIHAVGGNVFSSQVNIDSNGVKDGWIGLTVGCEIEQSALQALLYNIEAGMPFLFIDQLMVQVSTAGADGSRMRVLLGVSGQWRNGK
jgi:general secretion pathway protein M